MSDRNAKQPRKGAGRVNGKKQRTASKRPRPAPKIDEKVAKKVPKGGKLSAGEQHLRDQLMIARKAAGWPMVAIAEEAGIRTDSAYKAIAKKLQAEPLALTIDPVEVVEETVGGLQGSIGDLLAIAVQAQREKNYASAVSAIVGANRARAQVIETLQDVGAFRVLVDLRKLGETMARTCIEFRERMAALEVEPELREIIEAEAKRVEDTFFEYVEPPEKRELVA
jgi:hypothetical protein